MMTPSAENVPVVDAASFTAKKNVTFAVNYEVPLFERWGSSHVESVLKSTTVVANPTFILAKAKGEGAKSEGGSADVSVDFSSPSMPQSSEMREISASTTNCTPTTTASGKVTRRSNRGQKKRDVQLERHRVRYDMELVPPSRRNPIFLQRFPAWWSPEVFAPNSVNEVSIKSQRSSCCTTDCAGAEESTSGMNARESKTVCYCGNLVDGSASLRNPFEDDSSIVWIPSKRSEWEDCVSEMTAVCTSASLRRHAWSNSQQPFVAPLSREYIRDRVDIDDPLNGYQIRHRAGGWMQGFIIWTNFTTWTHYFKFDSLDIRSGITLPTSEKVDVDGSLSTELESQPRSGDPFVGGVVFDSIAEIGLLGAIGCGEVLLRMALDDIRLHHANKYKYIVLQATDESKSFYEKFGFIRVGAVCTYKSGEEGSEVVGYRHWTNANESERSLLMHGGPSYLMALKLPLRGEANTCEEFKVTVDCELFKPLSFLDEMRSFAVDAKPKIEQLGASSTPATKATRRKSLAIHKKRGPDGSPLGLRSVNNAPTQNDLTNESTSPTIANPSVSACTPTMCTQDATALVPVLSASGKNQVDESKSEKPVSDDAAVSHPNKRQKMGGTRKGPNAHQTLASSKAGTMSWAQKQYESIWLAVPCKQEAPMVGRKPPRDRSLCKPSEAGTENLNRQMNMPLDLIAQSQQLVEKTTPMFPVPVANAASKMPSSGSLARNMQIKPSVFHEEKLESLLSSGRALQPLSIEISATSATKTRHIQPQKKTVNKNRYSTLKKANPSPSVNEQYGRIDKASLVKQKMKSYPRFRLHFYNKVVRRKGSIGSSAKYYFVLHYDEQAGSIRIIPLQASGVLTGSRAGRPRWKVLFEETAKNIETVPTKDYEPVEAKMVMKTSYVAMEAWDILDT